MSSFLSPNNPTTALEQEISPAFLSFVEKMSRTSHLREFLLSLNSFIPKKLFTGEMVLFYESKHLGLRRLYVKNNQVYEKMAQRAWPEFQKTGYGNHEISLYLAREMGHPFAKALVIPFLKTYQNSKETPNKPVLFVEILKPGKTELHLNNFFHKRAEIINLILKRLLDHTSVSRASSLWGHVFEGWQEPLAILRKFKVIRSNEAFKKLAAEFPDLLSCQKRKGVLQLQNRIYNLHCYPVFLKENKNLSETSVLYCQDMTDYFSLREKLLHSEKMASLASLGQNMAHQLNNPLTGISSLIQVLQQNKQKLPFDEEFQELEKAARRCQKIIGSLLSFARSGEISHEVLDLNLVLEDTLPLLKTLLAKVKFTLKTNPKPLLVRGDFALLQQALFNIILNGCQALQGRPFPTLEIEAGLDEKKTVFLSVKDNGPGIPAEQKEKIFQALWTTKKQSEGTGLGLSMAQKAIQSFNGAILVSSAIEKGACFKIVLPLSNQQPTQKAVNKKETLSLEAVMV